MGCRDTPFVQRSAMQQAPCALCCLPFLRIIIWSEHLLLSLCRVCVPRSAHAPFGSAALPARGTARCVHAPVTSPVEATHSKPDTVGSSRRLPVKCWMQFVQQSLSVSAFSSAMCLKSCLRGPQAGVTEAVVDNYRLPQLVNGWEAGLLAFLRARVVAGGCCRAVSSGMGRLRDTVCKPHPHHTVRPATDQRSRTLACPRTCRQAIWRAPGSCVPRQRGHDAGRAAGGRRHSS